MSIIRSKKDRDNKYVQINKEMIEDPNLSLKSKGFITFCLSKPDNWSFYVQQLAQTLKEGPKAIYSSINECLLLGYATRYLIRSQDGKLLRWEMIISDSKEEIFKCIKELNDQGYEMPKNQEVKPTDEPHCQNGEVAHNEPEPLSQNGDVAESEFYEKTPHCQNGKVAHNESEPLRPFGHVANGELVNIDNSKTEETTTNYTDSTKADPISKITPLVSSSSCFYEENENNEKNNLNENNENNEKQSFESVKADSNLFNPPSLVSSFPSSFSINALEQLALTEGQKKIIYNMKKDSKGNPITAERILKGISCLHEDVKDIGGFLYKAIYNNYEKKMTEKDRQRLEEVNKQQEEVLREQQQKTAIGIIERILKEVNPKSYNLRYLKDRIEYKKEYVSNGAKNYSIQIVCFHSREFWSEFTALIQALGCQKYLNA